MTEEALSQADIDRMRHNQDILARIAKALKCRPDDVGKEIKKIQDRLAEIGEIMKDWKETG